MSAEGDLALRWLERRGVVWSESTGWDGLSPDGQELHSANDVAHHWTDELWVEAGLQPLEQLELALGLLDVLEEYWVTVEIGWQVNAHGEALRARMWEGFRQRLERSEPMEHLIYSLWVDWFEDRATAQRAFREVLGADVVALTRAERLDEFATGGLFIRAERVLGVSGPVPWGVKALVYSQLSRIPALHPGLLKAVMSSYLDLYGSLEPKPALALLDRLSIPPGTEDYVRLRTVLAAGHTNHYRSPQAWDQST